MKKLPLAIAMVTLLSATSGFAEDYRQDFEVSLDIPTSVNVEAFQTERVNLTMEDLSAAMNGTGASIGSMNIQTTARHCTASIYTDNGFRLMSVQGQGDLPYSLDYLAMSATGNSMATKFSEQNSYEKVVGCNVGDIVMRLARQESGMNNMYGTYNDIIHVEVRAES